MYSFNLKDYQAKENAMKEAIFAKKAEHLKVQLELAILEEAYEGKTSFDFDTDDYTSTRLYETKESQLIALRAFELLKESLDDGYESSLVKNTDSDMGLENAYLTIQIK